MTRAERIKAIRKVEWESPRVELQLLQSVDDEWLELSRVSCLNRPPSYALNLMQFFTDNGDFAIGPGVKLGARVRDVGHGGLKADDELVVFGCGVVELPVAEEGGGGGSAFGDPGSFSTCTEALISVGASPIRIAPAQVGRSYFAISSQSSVKTWIGLDSEPSQGSGVLLLDKGSSYDLHGFSGALYAVSESNATLSLTVCG